MLLFFFIFLIIPKLRYSGKVEEFVKGIVRGEENGIIGHIMITREEVKKLADLARLKVPEEELDKLTADFESILGYVSELKNAPVAEVAEDHKLINVLREDGNAHEPGLYTDDLVKAFSKARDNYLSVKPILTKGE